MFRRGDVPVPGYTLLDRLGSGQYGEVWEAQGPGGTHLAIKFISLQENKGQIELKSVNAVKLIRHANLIPIHAIWLLDTEGKVLSDEAAAKAWEVSNEIRQQHTLIPEELKVAQTLSYLVIAMAKADGNLEDRLKQCVAEGHTGIPAAELVRYIGEAASGLDFLNSPRHLVNNARVGIQHRDVKPANLLVIGGTVVVGDFGVATTVREFDATTTAVLGSLAFMAPESFAQKPSQASDQYALAISYYQLRCNQLPYNANVPLDELIAIHKEGRLNFSNISNAERQVLQKATSIDPRQRYANCREFCEALAEVFRPQPAIPKARSLKWVAALAGVLALASAFGFWLVDPWNWFGRRPPPVIEEIKTYVLAIEPSNATGQYSIRRQGAAEPEAAASFSGSINNIQLQPGDSLVISAENENPFFGSLQETLAFEELEQRQWKLQLPPVSLDAILGQVNALLDEGKTAAGEKLYLQAAKFEPKLTAVPAAMTHPLDQVTQFAVGGGGGAEIALAVRKKDDEPLLMRFESGQWMEVTPAAGDDHSPIESLSLNATGDELIVTRQQSIARWQTAASALQTLDQSGGGGNDTRWLISRVSPSHRWLAAANSQDTLRVWELSGSAQPPRLAWTHEMKRAIVDLVFSEDGNSLCVVGDSLPLMAVNLAAGEPAIADAPEQPKIGGDAIVHACRVGASALAVATDTQLVYSNAFFTPQPQAFAKLNGLNGGAIFLLRGAAQAPHLLGASDGDPTAVVWDLENGQPLAALGTERVRAIREVAISSDGRWAVIGTYDGTLGVLDLGEKPFQWNPLDWGGRGQIRFVAFSENLRYLFAISSNADSGDSSGTQFHAWDFRRCQLAWKARAE